MPSAGVVPNWAAWYGQITANGAAPLKSLAILSALLLPLAACNTGIDDRVLAGNWGSPSVKISASPAGVTLVFSCGVTGEIDRGVTLDASGAFTAPGSISDSRYLGALNARDTVSGHGTAVAVLATIFGATSGDNLTLTVRSSQPDVAPVTVMAQRNQPGPSGNEVCRT